MKYGSLPKRIGMFQVDCKEMMFYQDMPIKLAGDPHFNYEQRLYVFTPIIQACVDDFARDYGQNLLDDWYVYVSAKYLFQGKNKPYNREGWHCDGFMTEDINYVWCDRNPTVFNTSNFSITQDDSVSMKEMEDQALPENDVLFANNELLRLDQFVVHRVNPVQEEGFRTFLKVSFSKYKFDMMGNAKNYLLDYDWDMKPRGTKRNMPSTEPLLNKGGN